jgi:hypothetical protein
VETPAAVEVKSEKKSTKTIKIWNGTDFNNRGGRIYIAAYTLKQAIEMVNKAFGKNERSGYTYAIAKRYWVENCWGNPMNGILPAVGVWHQEKNDLPVKKIV